MVSRCTSQARFAPVEHVPIRLPRTIMIKPSKDGSPGIPVKTELFASEIAYRLHDTNARFEDFLPKARWSNDNGTQRLHSGA